MNKSLRQYSSLTHMHQICLLILTSSSTKHFQRFLFFKKKCKPLKLNWKIEHIVALIRIFIGTTESQATEKWRYLPDWDHGRYRPCHWLIQTSSLADSDHVTGWFRPRPWLIRAMFVVHILQWTMFFGGFCYLLFQNQGV